MIRRQAFEKTPNALLVHTPTHARTHTQTAHALQPPFYAQVNLIYMHISLHHNTYKYTHAQRERERERERETERDRERPREREIKTAIRRAQTP